MAGQLGPWQCSNTGGTAQRRQAAEGGLFSWWVEMAAQQCATRVTCLTVSVACIECQPVVLWIFADGGFFGAS